MLPTNKTVSFKNDIYIMIPTKIAQEYIDPKFFYAGMKAEIKKFGLYG